MKKYTINELRENRARAWEQAKQFLDSHRDEKGMLSAKDVATYEKMEQEIIGLGEEIKRNERGLALEAELSRTVGTPLTNRPGTGNDQKTGRASDAYKGAMLNALRTNFRQISNVLVEGTDSAGGYLVPDEWDSRLIEKLEQENIMRRLGTVIQTSGDHKINVAASYPTAAWIEEGGQIQFSDASFEQKVLSSYKLHAAVKISEELLADNQFGLENWLINAMGRSLANAEEAAMLCGDGNGKPYGITNATEGGQIGVTTESADTIQPDEVLDLVYALKRPYREHASFIMADSTLAALRRMKDGNGAFVWSPGMTAGEPDRLFGIPVYTSAYMPAIAAGQPVICLGDYSYYYLAERSARSFAALHELYAGVGQIGLLVRERVDGRLILPEAVQILKMGAAG